MIHRGYQRFLNYREMNDLEKIAGYFEWLNDNNFGQFFRDIYISLWDKYTASSDKSLDCTIRVEFKYDDKGVFLGKITEIPTQNVVVKVGEIENYHKKYGLLDRLKILFTGKERK